MMPNKNKSKLKRKKRKFCRQVRSRQRNMIIFSRCRFSPLLKREWLTLKSRCRKRGLNMTDCSRCTFMRSGRPISTTSYLNSANMKLKKRRTDWLTQPVKVIRQKEARVSPRSKLRLQLLTRKTRSLLTNLWMVAVTRKRNRLTWVTSWWRRSPKLSLKRMRVMTNLIPKIIASFPWWRESRGSRSKHPSRMLLIQWCL